MSGLADLARRMEIYAKAIEVGATQAVKEVAEAVGPVVVYSTPVDTSRARSNWQASVGTPIAQVLFPYPSAPASSDDGAFLAIKSIRAATTSYTGQSAGIFIVNNLDYIMALNMGSSSQAPPNFVEKAIVAGIKAARNVKLIRL